MLSPAYSFAWLLWRQHGRGFRCTGPSADRRGDTGGRADAWPDNVRVVVRNIASAWSSARDIHTLLLPFYVMVVFCYGLTWLMSVRGLAFRPDYFTCRRTGH